MSLDQIDNEAWRRQQLQRQLRLLQRERIRGWGRQREERPALFEEIGSTHHELGDSEHALGNWERGMHFMAPSPELEARMAAQGLYAAGVLAPGPIARCWAAVYAHLKEDDLARRNGVLPSRRAKAKAALHELLLRERGMDPGYRLLCSYAGIEPKPEDPRGTASSRRESKRSRQLAGSPPREPQLPSSSRRPRARLARGLVQLTDALSVSSQPLAALHLLASLHSSEEREDLLAPEQVSALERLSETPCLDPAMEAQRRCLAGAAAHLGRSLRQPDREAIAKVRAGLDSLVDAVLRAPADASPAPRHLAEALDWLQAHAGSNREIEQEVCRVYQALSKALPRHRLAVVGLGKNASRLLGAEDLIALVASDPASLSLGDWEALTTLLEERGGGLPEPFARSARQALFSAATEICEFTLPLLTSLLRGGGVIAESLRSEALRWAPYAAAWVDLAQVQLHVERRSPLALDAFDLLRHRVEGSLTGFKAMRILTRLLDCVAHLPPTAGFHARLEETLLNGLERPGCAGGGSGANEFVANEYASALVRAAEKRAHSLPDERSRSLLRIEGCVRYALARLDRLEPAPFWFETVAAGLEGLERCGAQEASLVASAARIAAGLLKRGGSFAHAGGHLALTLAALRDQRWAKSVAKLEDCDLEDFDLRELVLFGADQAGQAPFNLGAQCAIPVAKLAQSYASAGVDLKGDGPELVLRLAALLKPSGHHFAW